MTLEGWVDVMYDLMDGAALWAFAYMVPVVLFGGLIIINLFLAVLVQEFDMADKGAYEASVPRGHNGVVYVVEGEVKLAGTTLSAGEVALPSAGRLPLEGQAGTRVAVLHGRPHREGIVHRGPYVD